MRDLSMEHIAKLEAQVDALKRWVNDLQSGMYVNCIYCGHRYGPEEETPVAMADVLKEHIEQCPQHPMSKLKKELVKEKEDHATCRDTLSRVIAGTCQLQVELSKLQRKAQEDQLQKPVVE